MFIRRCMVNPSARVDSQRRQGETATKRRNAMPDPTAASLDNAGFAVPALACDCHMHVFGDPARYPPAAWRAYDPTEMDLPAHEPGAGALGLARGGAAQPGPRVPDAA